MCGRYELYTEGRTDELTRVIAQIVSRNPDAVFQTGEIRPTDTAPVMIMENGRIRAGLMKWGFLNPGKAADSRKERIIINARAETAADKPMFRNCLYRRRCVVAGTGFFEWSHDGRKQKYRLALPDRQALYMAGLYELYEDGPHFVILTIHANESLRDIHDRMPLILSKDQVRSWLADGAFALSFLQSAGPLLKRKTVDGQKNINRRIAADSPASETYEQLSLPL